ncbi:MAG: hypothetical protein QW291_02480 [Thermofilaceae archaeon]
MLSTGFIGLLLSALIALALIAIGVLIIVFVIKAIILLIPAGLVALIVWLLTSDAKLTAIAFLVVALVCLLKRL